MGDDDEDEATGSHSARPGPLPPDDRLWRHPSELGRSGPASALPARRRGTDRSGVAFGLAAACLAGAVVAVGALWVVTRPAEVAVAPVGSGGVPAASLASTGAVLPAATLVIVEVVRADQRTRATAMWLDESGAALVPAPAVEGADGLTVTVGGARRPARILGTDPTTALALVRIDARAQSVVRPTPVAPTAGVEVAVHRPGTPSGTELVVDAALVSRSGVRSTIDGQVVHDTVHLDRTLPADALGALVLDADGAAVGMIVDPGTNGNQAVAIPAATAFAVGDDLNDDGEIRRAWLGVRATDVDGGAELHSVQAGSPADAAGLLVGDVVTEVDDVTIADASDLVMAIQAWRPGERVRVTWQRDGQPSSAELILGG